MSNKEVDVEPGQSFIVGAFRPEDARGIAKLFRTVYGDEYPMKLAYDPDGTIAAFHAEENIPVLARTPKGDVVAHEAFYRSAASPRTYEIGQGVTHPSYRNLGAMDMIQEYMCETMAPAMDLDVAFGECVCNHVFMQKSMARVKGVPTALEVDLMPVEAYTKEGSASGRVATLLMFRTFRPRPHTVYVPERYAEALAYSYQGIDDERTLVPAHAHASPTGPSTAITAQVFDFAQVARLAVHEAGGDFAAAFESEEKRALARGVVVVQAWLKLSWPWISSMVEHLKGKGYFYGGPLIQWFGVDGLLMQKIFTTPSWDGIHLYSDRAEKIGEYIKNDWSEGNR